MKDRKNILKKDGVIIIVTIMVLTSLFTVTITPRGDSSTVLLEEKDIKNSSTLYDVLLDEDFSGTLFPPAGWTDEHKNYHSSYGWRKSFTSTAGGSMPEAYIPYNYALVDYKFYSYAFDTSQYSYCELEFKSNIIHRFDHGLYTLKAGVSLDGSSWTEVWNYTPCSNDQFEASVPIPGGSSNTYIGFWVSGDTTYYIQWYLDNIIIRGMYPDDLMVIDLKPIQVIEDADEFIINKNTVVCVDVINSFSSLQQVDIEVSYDFGRFWYLEDGPHGNGVPLQPGLNRVYIPGGPVYYETGQTNYWIGEGADPWLTWTSTGFDNNIGAYVDSSNEISESNENNNDLVIVKKFVDSIDFRVLVVPVYFPHADPPIGENKPFSVNMSNQDDFLFWTYPIAENRFEYDITAAKLFMGNPMENLQQFWTWIYQWVVAQLVIYANAYNYQRVVVVLHHEFFYVTFFVLGIAIGFIQEPYVHEPVVVMNIPHEGLVAHEIGHTYWLWHPHDLGPSVYDAERFCVENRDYGDMCTTFMSYLDPPRWIDKGRYDSNPDEIRTYTYYGEVINMRAYNLFDQFRQTNMIPRESEQETIELGGIIYKNGSVIPIEPWLKIKTGDPNLFPSNTGDYFLVLTDIYHNILSKSGFNVSFEQWIDDENGALMRIETYAAPFVFSLPYVSGSKYIELWDSNDTILISKTITPNSPTVTVLDPNGGETILVGKEYNIIWDANDNDDDSLSYSISYSTNGEDWIPFVWDLAEKQFLWNTSDLDIGDNYKIQVMACDGINTGKDESDGTFNLISRTPSPPIISGPTSGKAGAEYKYTFNATDPDGDEIAKYIVEWGDGTDETIKGPFSSGEEANASHTWIKAGDYVITAKAVDEHGLEGSEGTLTVKIPRTKTKSYLYDQWFLERFPFLERLLSLIRAI